MTLPDVLAWVGQGFFFSRFADTHTGKRRTISGLPSGTGADADILAHLADTA